MSVTWFVLLLKKYRKLKWFSAQYQIFSDFIFLSLSTEIWEPKCQNSIQPEECKTLRHLRNNDRFQVEYISSYSINKNSCSLKAQTHSTQHRMWCRTAWRGWLDDDVFFGLSDGTWWINDVWIPYYWRSVTFKNCVEYQKIRKNIEVIKRVEGINDTYCAIWLNAPPNIKTILTHCEFQYRFFCVSFSCCVLSHFFRLLVIRGLNIRTNECWMTSTGNFWFRLFLSQRILSVHFQNFIDFRNW